MRYTRNYGQPNAVIVFCEDVFTGMQYLELENLPLDEKLFFEVRANNKKMNSPWSAPFPKTIS